MLRRITDVGGTASYDEVQQYFAGHPTDPIPLTKIGGTLTSIKAVQRRVGPADADQLLQRDERARLYRVDQPLMEGLKRAFALADARPDLLRRDPVTWRGRATGNTRLPQGAMEDSGRGRALERGIERGVEATQNGGVG
ncbi:hypothetical protein [Streptomyces europaeiscabiei]|uniref:hypothetical protein n=1 Tax=Streptomyces europaeiscabiei TaxID=146819 RepID=UPI002E129B34|nr:hypothetical protein OHB30_50620 [Streptomyces europaeiscabiei]